MTHFARGLPIDDTTGKMGQVSSPGPTVARDGKLIEVATGKIVIDGIGAQAAAANGFTFTAAGALRINGVAGALPAGTCYQNGFPFAPGGQLCTDGTNAIAYSVGGVPFTTIGAVAAS